MWWPYETFWHWLEHKLVVCKNWGLVPSFIFLVAYLGAPEWINIFFSMHRPTATTTYMHQVHTHTGTLHGIGGDQPKKKELHAFLEQRKYGTYVYVRTYSK
jgi:hypothetical protein